MKCEPRENDDVLHNIERYDLKDDPLKQSIRNSKHE